MTRQDLIGQIELAALVVSDVMYPDMTALDLLDHLLSLREDDAALDRFLTLTSLRKKLSEVASQPAPPKPASNPRSVLSR